MEKKAKDAGKKVDNHLNKKLDAIQAEVIKNADFGKYEEPEELEGDAESQAKQLQNNMDSIMEKINKMS